MDKFLENKIGVGVIDLDLILQFFLTPATNSHSHLSLVDVTPTPVFTRFEGLDDRMAARKKMFSGVAIRRRFAAADVTASQTQAQMQPRRTDFQTILAT